MIDTTKFTEVGTMRKDFNNRTCIKVYSDVCRIQFSKNDFKAVESFIGHACSIAHTPDLKTIVIRMGADRRISVNHTVSIKQFREIAVARFGERVSTIMYDSKWDTDEKGRKVLVLTETGKVRYGVD